MATTAIIIAAAVVVILTAKLYFLWFLLWGWDRKCQKLWTTHKSRLWTDDDDNDSSRRWWKNSESQENLVKLLVSIEHFNLSATSLSMSSLSSCFSYSICFTFKISLNLCGSRGASRDRAILGYIMGGLIIGTWHIVVGRITRGILILIGAVALVYLAD